MKKILTLFSLLGILLSAPSCSTDPDNIIVLIPGNWTISDVHFIGTSNTVNNGVTVNSSTYDAVGSNLALDIVYTDNPDEYQSSGQYTLTATTIYAGNPLPVIQTFNNMNPFLTGTWVVDNNLLQMSVGATVVVIGAVIFSNNHNTMEIHTVSVTTLTNGGDVTTINMNKHYTFTRQ